MIFIHRGEIEIDPQLSSRLKCYYSRGHHPFLLLQPVKVEQVSLEPSIVVYHDVISDDEINTIKEIGKSKVRVEKICLHATTRRLNHF